MSPRRPIRQLACESGRLFKQRFVRDHPIDDAAFQHRLRRHLLRCERPLHGESFADTLRNSLYAAEHRHDPERLLGMPEAGAGASEYYVRSNAELETAPEATALHFCDCQLWKPIPLIDRADTLF